MNKLWIFEILTITSPKVYANNTKTVIQHDLQELHCTFLDCYTPHSHWLPAYGNGTVPIIGKLPFLESYSTRFVTHYFKLFKRVSKVTPSRVSIAKLENLRRSRIRQSQVWRAPSFASLWRNSEGRDPKFNSLQTPAGYAGTRPPPSWPAFSKTPRQFCQATNPVDR